MAKRNILKLDTSGFEQLITQLEALSGDVKSAVTDALMSASSKITADTKEAMQPQYLPHQGKYSKGRTVETIIDPAVQWSGTKAEVEVGFDYTKGGAGGYLISGTPKMQPAQKLSEIYTRKKYMSALQKDMQDIVMQYIKNAMR